jgi:dihydrofolate synthase/folylpolyglutamate synthase
LTKTLRQVFAGRKVILVLGVMRDKPLKQMMHSFSQLADTLILVNPQQERSKDPYRLQKEFLHGHSKVEVIEAIPEAIRSAMNRASSKDIICVTGSIFTVAEARKWMADDSIPDNSGSLLGS